MLMVSIVYTVVVDWIFHVILWLWLEVIYLHISIGCRLRSLKMLSMRWRMMVPWSYGLRDSVTWVIKEYFCCLRKRWFYKSLVWTCISVHITLLEYRSSLMRLIRNPSYLIWCIQMCMIQLRQNLLVMHHILYIHWWSFEEVMSFLHDDEIQIM